MYLSEESKQGHINSSKSEKELDDLMDLIISDNLFAFLELAK